MRPAFSVHRDADALNRALAADVAARLAAAVAERGRASLVVSGGRTPVGFFDLLSLQAIEWPSVTVTLADERWVDPAHADSNERLVRAHLLCNAAAKAHFVSLKNAAVTPEDGAAACGAALAQLARPFDVVVLGMGDDAHTASLFPGATQLPTALSTVAACVAVRPPRAPHARMSLSLNALLDSRAIRVQISGAGKRQVMEQALDAGAVADMPIRAILHQRQVPVEILWCP